jgi:hypothetical protein
VPLTVQPAWVGELRGITLPDVNLKVLEGGKPLAARRGSMLFAHFGLTGPAPLDVSPAVSGHPSPAGLVLEVDLLPGEPEQLFDEFLRTESLASGKKQLAVVLAEKLPRRVCDQLLILTGHQVDRKAAALDLADRLKFEMDDEAESARAVDGTLYADLLNAALQEANRREIAEHCVANLDRPGSRPESASGRCTRHPASTWPSRARARGTKCRP